MQSVQRYLISWILSHAVGVADIHPGDIATSLVNGDADIRNVKLRVSRLNDFIPIESPVDIAGGIIDHCHISVPWLDLATQPIVVEVTGVRFTISGKRHSSESSATDFQKSETSLKESLERNLTAENVLGASAACLHSAFEGLGEDEEEEEFRSAISEEDAASLMSCEDEDRELSGDSRQTSVVASALSALKGAASYVLPSGWSAPKCYRMYVRNVEAALLCGDILLQLEINNIEVVDNPNEEEKIAIIRGLGVHILRKGKVINSLLLPTDLEFKVTMPLANYTKVTVHCFEVCFAATEQCVVESVKAVLNLLGDITVIPSYCHHLLPYKYDRQWWPFATNVVLEKIRHQKKRWNLSVEHLVDFGDLRREYVNVLHTAHDSPTSFDSLRPELLAIEERIRHQDVIAAIRSFVMRSRGVSPFAPTSPQRSQQVSQEGFYVHLEVDILKYLLPCESELKVMGITFSFGTVDTKKYQMQLGGNISVSSLALTTVVDNVEESLLVSLGSPWAVVDVNVHMGAKEAKSVSISAQLNQLSTTLSVPVLSRLLGSIEGVFRELVPSLQSYQRRLLYYEQESKTSNEGERPKSSVDIKANLRMAPWEFTFAPFFNVSLNSVTFSVSQSSHGFYLHGAQLSSSAAQVTATTQGKRRCQVLDPISLSVLTGGCDAHPEVAFFGCREDPTHFILCHESLVIRVPVFVIKEFWEQLKPLQHPVMSLVEAIGTLESPPVPPAPPAESVTPSPTTPVSVSPGLYSSRASSAGTSSREPRPVLVMHADSQSTHLLSDRRTIFNTDEPASPSFQVLWRKSEILENAKTHAAIGFPRVEVNIAEVKIEQKNVLLEPQELDNGKASFCLQFEECNVNVANGVLEGRIVEGTDSKKRIIRPHLIVVPFLRSKNVVNLILPRAEVRVHERGKLKDVGERYDSSKPFVTISWFELAACQREIFVRMEDLMLTDGAVRIAFTFELQPFVREAKEFEPFYNAIVNIRVKPKALSLPKLAVAPFLRARTFILEYFVPTIQLVIRDRILRLIVNGMTNMNLSFCTLPNTGCSIEYFSGNSGTIHIKLDDQWQSGSAVYGSTMSNASYATEQVNDFSGISAHGNVFMRLTYHKETMEAQFRFVPLIVQFYPTAASSFLQFYAGPVFVRFPLRHLPHYHADVPRSTILPYFSIGKIELQVTYKTDEFDLFPAIVRGCMRGIVINSAAPNPEHVDVGGAVNKAKLDIHLEDKERVADTVKFFAESLKDIGELRRVAIPCTMMPDKALVISGHHFGTLDNVVYCLDDPYPTREHPSVLCVSRCEITLSNSVPALFHVSQPVVFRDCHFVCSPTVFRLAKERGCTTIAEVLAPFVSGCSTHDIATLTVTDCALECSDVDPLPFVTEEDVEPILLALPEYLQLSVLLYRATACVALPGERLVSFNAHSLESHCSFASNTMPCHVEMGCTFAGATCNFERHCTLIDDGLPHRSTNAVTITQVKNMLEVSVRLRKHTVTRYEIEFVRGTNNLAFEFLCVPLEVVREATFLGQAISQKLGSKAVYTCLAMEPRSTEKDSLRIKVSSLSFPVSFRLHCDPFDIDVILPTNVPLARCCGFHFALSGEAQRDRLGFRYLVSSTVGGALDFFSLDLCSFCRVVEKTALDVTGELRLPGLGQSGTITVDVSFDTCSFVVNAVLVRQLMLLVRYLKEALITDLPTSSSPSLRIEDQTGLHVLVRTASNVLACTSPLVQIDEANTRDMLVDSISVSLPLGNEWAPVTFRTLKSNGFTEFSSLGSYCVFDASCCVVPFVSPLLPRLGQRLVISSPLLVKNTSKDLAVVFRCDAQQLLSHSSFVVNAGETIGVPYPFIDDPTCSVQFVREGVVSSPHRLTVSPRQLIQESVNRTEGVSYNWGAVFPRSSKDHYVLCTARYDRLSKLGILELSPPVRIANKLPFAVLIDFGDSVGTIGIKPGDTNDIFHNIGDDRGTPFNVMITREDTQSVFKSANRLSMDEDSHNVFSCPAGDVAPYSIDLHCSVSRCAATVLSFSLNRSKWCLVESHCGPQFQLFDENTGLALPPLSPNSSIKLAPLGSSPTYTFFKRQEELPQLQSGMRPATAYVTLDYDDDETQNVAGFRVRCAEGKGLPHFHIHPFWEIENASEEVLFVRHSVTEDLKCRVLETLTVPPKSSIFSYCVHPELHEDSFQFACAVEARLLRSNLQLSTSCSPLSFHSSAVIAVPFYDGMKDQERTHQVDISHTSSVTRITFSAARFPATLVVNLLRQPIVLNQKFVAQNTALYDFSPSVGTRSTIQVRNESNRSFEAVEFPRRPSQYELVEFNAVVDYYTVERCPGVQQDVFVVSQSPSLLPTSAIGTRSDTDIFFTKVRLGVSGIHVRFNGPLLSAVASCSDISMSISSFGTLSENIVEARVNRVDLKDESPYVAEGDKKIVAPFSVEVQLSNIDASGDAIRVAAVRASGTPINICSSDEFMSKLIAVFEVPLPPSPQAGAAAAANKEVKGKPPTGAMRCSPKKDILQLPVFFQEINLGEISLVVSYIRSGNPESDVLRKFVLSYFVGTVHKAHVLLPSYVKTDFGCDNLITLGASLTSHYSNSLLEQWQVILSSYQLFGSPFAVVGGLVAGVGALLSEPPTRGISTFIRSAVRAPFSAAAGFVAATNRLVHSLSTPGKEIEDAFGKHPRWVCDSCEEIEEELKDEGTLNEMLKLHGPVQLHHHISERDLIRALPRENVVTTLPLLRATSLPSPRSATSGSMRSTLFSKICAKWSQGENYFDVLVDCATPEQAAAYLPVAAVCHVARLTALRQNHQEWLWEYCKLLCNE